MNNTCTRKRLDSGDLYPTIFTLVCERVSFP